MNQTTFQILATLVLLCTPYIEFEQTTHILASSQLCYGYINCHTPANEEKWPPLFGERTEDHHQLEVEHDTLTQHPAEGRQEQVLK